jgi:hypothetical protein
MWEHCEAKVVSIKKETGEAEVRVNLDPKISFTDKSKFLVYAFEEANVQDKGVYLGEFRLTPDGEKKAKLDPTNRLTPRESDRLASAKKTWVLYDQMPYDSHDAFVHLSDEEKTAMLPAASVAEYVKDGKPSDPNDLQEVVVDGKYVRPLRDYQTLFNADRMNWTEMVDLFAATQRDKNLVEVSLDEAQQQKVASERHVARQEKELAKYTRERDIMAAHHEKVQQKLAAVTTEVAKLMRTNQAMAGQIARFQWDAVRRIDQRVRAMVQLDTKGI